MAIIYGDQGTDLWHETRRGKVSASHMSDILMKTTTAGYRNYLAKLTLERVTGQTEKTYCSHEMSVGTELEPEARTCYEFETGNHVTQCMWVEHPLIEFAGCSPDGLIFEGDIVAGLVEIKCPKAATHLDFLLDGKIPRGYQLQMQWQMSTTGAEWCDYCSYHPAFPQHQQIRVHRVFADKKKIAELELATIGFDMAVVQMIADLSETK